MISMVSVRVDSVSMIETWFGRSSFGSGCAEVAAISSEGGSISAVVG